MNSSTTICICTRNRPDELRRCLQSIARSTVPVDQIVVSDDSTDMRTGQMIQAEFPGAQYLPGPRRGLGANRNCALRGARGTHILFLDDDACLGETFLSEALRAASRSGVAQVIVSGVENNHGHLVFAHDQGFLGHQNVAYPEGEALRTIVINSTLFPCAVFERVRFDEGLIYGYDEVDIATQALQAGFVIAGCRTAVNLHFPSALNRDYYRPHTEASRLYVTLRRYGLYERNVLKAGAFAAAAPVHLLAHALRRGGAVAAVEALRTIGRAIRMLGAAATA